MAIPLPKFSHIYIEKDALNLERTQIVLKKFSSSELIMIDSYKEILNRSKQSWQHQKLSSKLILAIKKDNFLYKGSPVTPNFNFEHFYYNSLALNCIYDCQYCYLQGMFPSAHLVAFMNLEDFFDSTLRTLQDRSPLYLCISYDTDLMALEGIFSYCKEWIGFASDHPSLFIELRTKSVNIKFLKDTPACDNIIIAWTLSPQSIIEKYEIKTPSLKARVKALKECAALGWKVRICFDPIIRTSQWSPLYQELIEYISSEVPASYIKEFSVGSFRMNNQYYSRLAGKHKSDLFYDNYERDGGIVQYSSSARDEIVYFMKDSLNSHFPLIPINFC